MQGEFLGTERFEILERLGAGGMGVVYRAFDRSRGVVVALKTLHRLDAESILRLKQEFRGIRHVAHPNLVALFDLVSEADLWFFTMELVPGCTFLEWVRTEPNGANLDRLRAALRQLVLGVASLHAAGVIHRDLKPTNVMVRPDGRVSVLDFGLVRRLDARASRQSPDDLSVSGTLEYLAPEQSDAGSDSPSSDWYSVGVMLFEALTGRVPFSGAPMKMLIEKRRLEAPSPGSLVAGLPGDLVELCNALLRRAPEQRPGVAEILARLDAIADAASVPEVMHAPGRLLIGRAAHLQALRSAFETQGVGQGVAVFVHGSSGMGKSALVEHFLEEAARLPEVWVLSGRCYERESVPYKALDSVIDELTHMLTAMPRTEVAAVLAPEVRALARLFPVLRHVPAVENLPPMESVPDPRELRRRAVGALRSLLVALSRRRRIIVSVDDLQWGDADSGAVLAEVLRPPGAPSIMLLGTYRTEEAANSAFLETFHARLAGREAARAYDIEVGPLTADEVNELSARLLGHGPGGLAADARVIAAESRGSPFFVEALVGYLRGGGEEVTETRLSSGLSLGEVLRRRLADLPPEARRLLSVTAVAGRPTDREVIRAAAGLGAEMPTTLALLRARHLVRVRVVGEMELIESYHDRIRETLVEGLDDETARRTHRDVGLAMESAGSTDFEALAEHFVEAQDTRRSGDYYARAADRAREALAFDRAAALFQRALDLHRTDAPVGSASADGERLLLTRLAEALVDAGRCVEAARAFLEAARHAPTVLALDLQRRAGEQLMISGHLDEGKAVLEQVLLAIDMRLPATPRRALFSLLAWRVRLRLRGLGFTPRDEREVSTAALSKVDLAWAVGLGLGLVDHVRAADYQARSLHLSLESGERYRIARSLAMEVAYAASVGQGGRARVQRLRAVTDVLVPAVDRPHTHGLYAYCLGVVGYSWGRWSEALGHFERSERVYVDETTGLNWEVPSCQLFLLSTLGQMGNLGEIARRVPGLLDEARARGNLYAATNLRTGYPSLTWLALDEPDTARRMVADAMAEWSKSGFHLQHYFDFVAETNVDLYTGEARAAFERVLRFWPGLEESLWQRVEVVRIDTHVHRARCALAALGAGVESERARAIARKDARVLAREAAPWARPNALQIQGTLAWLDGRASEAVTLLEAAEDAFGAVEMPLHAAVMGLRRAECRAGEPHEVALQRIRARGVMNPRAIADMLAPGWGARPGST
jgi:tetratricopeptide (TPR) repeat protein